MLFKTLKKYMAIIGLYEHESDEDSCFNRRNVGILFLFVLYLVLTIAFLLFDANSVSEYSVGFYELSTILSVFIGFTIMIKRSRDLFRLSNTTKKIVEFGMHVFLLL